MERWISWCRDGGVGGEMVELAIPISGAAMTKLVRGAIEKRWSAGAGGVMVRM